MKNPKYKFGDKVTVIRQGKVIVDAKITAIIQYGEDDEPRYFVDHTSETILESAIFPSKKDLIKSL